MSATGPTNWTMVQIRDSAEFKILDRWIKSFFMNHVIDPVAKCLLYPTNAHNLNTVH